MLLRTKYDAPLCRSLDWVLPDRGIVWLMVQGPVLAVAASLVGTALQAPNVDNPLNAASTDKLTLVLTAVFGVSV